MLTSHGLKLRLCNNWQKTKKHVSVSRPGCPCLELKAEEDKAIRSVLPASIAVTTVDDLRFLRVHLDLRVRSSGVTSRRHSDLFPRCAELSFLR